MRTIRRRVSITAEGRAAFHHGYVGMEMATKPNNSSGSCDENERGNLLPGLIQISKHVFRWEKQPKYSPPQGGQQMAEGRSKAALLAGFRTAGKRLISAKPAA